MEILVIVALVAFAAGCFVAAIVGSSRKGYTEEQVQLLLIEDRAKTRQNTLKQSSATIKGQIGERFAPFSKGFGFKAADARFLGSPIDYVVFDGLTDGHVKGVVFVEVKVGPLPLSLFQKQVKQAIDRKDVRWHAVQLPDISWNDEELGREAQES